MPLLVKDYDWHETEQSVVIRVPLKGVSSKNADIFSSDRYIKVHYPPYLFEVALQSVIKDELSKATIGNGLITFELQKETPALWHNLEDELHDDKVYMHNVREQAIMYKQKQADEKKKIRESKMDEIQKLAVREQMKVEEMEHEKRLLAKQLEHAQASKDIDDFKNEIDFIESKPERSEFRPEKVSAAMTTKPESSFCDSASVNKETDKQKALPAPRCSGTIPVRFTARQLQTPARESKLPEEELWLQKLATMNRMKAEASKDLADMEEMNPIWLKDKGNRFYKSGDYVAAINAYTAGLMLDGKVPMLYANRAACHLHMKQYRECVQDCTMALELYDPPCQSNQPSRLRVLTRRGTAFYHMENYVEALRDYETAIKLDPKNLDLRADAFLVRRIIQGEETDGED